MDISEVLSRLEVKSGPNDSGEYLCKCPAHDDRKASLCVREGDKGIILCCQAGCTTDAVVQAMGIQLRDLFREPRGRKKLGRTTAQKAVKPVEAAANPPAQTTEKAPEEKKKIDRIYTYTDEEGKTVFEVVRYIPKTFRQRVPDPTARGGYRWTIKGVRPVLYKLPSVMAAIKDGRPIYVVEGEKDADNMALLGYTATTCPMGAGKWHEEHTAFLKGAKEVRIIGDNDEPGQMHAKKVASYILGTVNVVKILNLKEVCPDLPEKGDVSDFFGLIKSKRKGMELLERLADDTAPYTISEEDERDRAVQLYEKVGGYCVDDGCICQWTNEGPKTLGNFLALPTKIVTRDDGVNLEKVFVIDGWTRSGRTLPQVFVPASKFPQMGWVLDSWDFAANIMPGNTVKDRLRYAISEVGEMYAKRETVYTHMGWRKLGGKWAYLYPGGAVGAKDVRVEMDGALRNYTLDGAEEASDMEAAMASYMIKNAMAAHISIPMLGLVYLTPLREFLAQTGFSPRFALFLLGGTGTHKSTAVALALSHFGTFTFDSLPASFHDTPNSIRKKAFILKDSLLAVDDYHPETSLQERRRMEATAQALARAFGDGADRGRLNADLSLQESMPPRGLSVMSGEDMPNIGESGVARFYIVPITKKDIPIVDALEDVQEMARRGYMRRAMRAYIGWLARRADELPAALAESYIKLRKQAIKDGGSMHGRAAEAVAHVMLGYKMMLEWMSDAGIMGKADAEREFSEAWAVVTENSARQGRDAQDERPSKMFLTTVSEMLASRVIGVKNLEDAAETGAGPNMVGYRDSMYYYLLPDMIFTKVSKMYQEQGMAFPLTKRMLYKQLRDDGMIQPDGDGKTTKPKRIDGKMMRFLWIEARRIDGESEKAAEATMKGQQVSLAGFTPVKDEPMPF